MPEHFHWGWPRWCHWNLGHCNLFFGSIHEFRRVCCSMFLWGFDMASRFASLNTSWLLENVMSALSGAEGLKAWLLSNCAHMPDLVSISNYLHVQACCKVDSDDSEDSYSRILTTFQNHQCHLLQRSNFQCVNHLTWPVYGLIKHTLCTENIEQVTNESYRNWQIQLVFLKGQVA